MRPNQWNRKVEIAKRVDFDAQIMLKHGNLFTIPAKEFVPNPQDAWDEENHPIPVTEADVVDAKCTPLSPVSVADTLISDEIVLPQGGACI